ncbi:DUF1365 domain-containing protein [Aliikangiella maris]|uniref:DUF1365 domain-containing protein n=2 Tax=Aliikangiella maris TaxID=3162458 RepID=A0ABV3MNH8_9GAMM
MNSKIYSGHLQHRRFLPSQHEFQYKIFMLYIDIDELDNLFKPFWFWSKDKFNLGQFKTADYFHHQGSIRDAITNEIRERYAIDFNGSIRMLTHLRYWGYCFNPVTFYYCFNQHEPDKVDFIISEVNNTPWNERYRYVMDNRDGSLMQRNVRFLNEQFHKTFHVSPFMPMDIRYEWRFSQPAERLSVVMQNFSDDKKVFDATLALKQQPMTQKNMAKILLHFPPMTVKVITGIYWQALKLWLKKTPFYENKSPKKISH